MASLRFSRRGSSYADGWSVHGILSASGALHGEVKKLSEGWLQTFEIQAEETLAHRLITLLDMIPLGGDPAKPLALQVFTSQEESRSYYLDHASTYHAESAEREIHAIVRALVEALLPCPIGAERPVRPVEG